MTWQLNYLSMSKWLKNFFVCLTHFWLNIIKKKSKGSATKLWNLLQFSLQSSHFFGTRVGYIQPRRQSIVKCNAMIAGWGDQSCKIKYTQIYNGNNSELYVSHVSGLRETHTEHDQQGIFKTHNVLTAHSISNLHATGCHAKCNPVVKS